MAEHIVCITASGGIPLLSRTKPGCSPLSFPVVGSLNAVHMFGLNRNAKLLSTLSTDQRIVWKMYEDSIVLIAVAPTEDKLNLNLDKSKSDNPGDALQQNVRSSASSVSDSHLLRLLDNVFHALVLLTGLNELISCQNIDHLKKDLRSCYKLIDTFLETDIEISRKCLFGGLTNCVDIVLNSDKKLLEWHLQAFVEAADSTYGCLVANGQVVCATNKWWTLNAQELVLLARLISVVPPAITASDVAVYLPHSSANIAHRLLIFTLVSGFGQYSSAGIRACVVCGPQPSLSHVQNTCVNGLWSPGMATLQKCVRADSIPSSLLPSLPSDLLGFLLVDVESSTCLSLTTPPSVGRVTTDLGNRRRHQPKNETHDPVWIYSKLCEFYKHVAGTSFPLPESVEEPLPSHYNISTHTGLSHYRCMAKHKCYALRQERYQIYALFSNDAPTFAMQSLTEKTLNVLTNAM